MSTEIVIVLGILAATIILFVTDAFSPDVVAMLSVMALVLSRVLSVPEALAGFANPAVITIATIFLVTAGLTNTGIAARIGTCILRIAGNKEARLVAITMTASATLSLIMNNIAAASVLLPGLKGIARRTGIKPSKLMIPLSFGTIMGGMSTVFTTINLLANDSLHRSGFVPFSFWDYFRIGSLLSLAAIGFMVVLGRRILPSHSAEGQGQSKCSPEELARIDRSPDPVREESICLGEIKRPDKAPWAIVGLILMLVIAVLGLLPIAAAALVGALVMIISGAIKTEEGYRVIEWRVIVIIGGMLSLGTAMTKSGAADLISHHFLHVVEPLGHLPTMAGFFLISMFFAQILSGAASIVLIAPIALSTAAQLHVSAYPFIMTLVLGASSGFLTPVSHPVNVLVMGPGGYKFVDYARVGSCLAVIVFLLTILLVPLFWPL